MEQEGWTKKHNLWWISKCDELNILLLKKMEEWTKHGVGLEYKHFYSFIV